MHQASAQIYTTLSAVLIMHWGSELMFSGGQTHLGAAKQHHGTIVHGMMEDGASKHQAVQQCDSNTDICASFHCLQIS